MLTPQVLAGLLDAETLVLEVAGDLATVREVTGKEHTSGGQAELGTAFTDALDSILAGLRPHTWPDRRGGTRGTQRPRRAGIRPTSAGRDPRRRDRRTTLMVRLGLGSFGLVFTAFGVAAWLLR